jgi:hypothetical protein
MPTSPHLPGSRFFARLRTFDLECPACGTVYVISTYQAKRNMRGRKAATRSTRSLDPAARQTTTGRTWSDVLQRFECAACGGTFALGIVAWPVRQGSRLQPAEDTLPTPKQARAIREQAGGWKLTTKSGADDPRNVRVSQPCSCQPDHRGIVDPGCAIHGAEQGRLAPAPQKVWAGSLPNKPRRGGEYDEEG